MSHSEAEGKRRGSQRQRQIDTDKYGNLEEDGDFKSKLNDYSQSGGISVFFFSHDTFIRHITYNRFSLLVEHYIAKCNLVFIFYKTI